MTDTGNTTERMTVSIVGGSGYTGGELLRLLLDHPGVTVQAVTSRANAGEPLHRKHPNLRGRSDLLFTAPDELEKCDVVFLCMPHGRAAKEIDRYNELGDLIVDLSADFRLRDAETYKQWYREDHPAPHRLADVAYGLPELNRTNIAGSRFVSGVGCNATAMNLALAPLAKAGLIERVIADIKVGSSEAGAEPSASSHHPERSRAVRSYALTGHRHAAEVHQMLGDFTLDVTVTAIEMVRGVLCTAHVIPTETLAMKDLWKLYRGMYRAEPFVRLVCERTGLFRLPDPAVLGGSNYADVGFGIDDRTGRVVALCAIDNLMKGAAGSAVQAMNIALGFDETAGLTFPGLHPA